MMMLATALAALAFSLTAPSPQLALSLRRHHGATLASTYVMSADAADDDRYAPRILMLCCNSTQREKGEREKGASL